MLGQRLAIITGCYRFVADLMVRLPALEGRPLAGDFPVTNVYRPEVTHLTVSFGLTDRRDHRELRFQGRGRCNGRTDAALEADRDRYLGYTRVVGRGRANARLEEPIESIDPQYTVSPLLRDSG